VHSVVETPPYLAAAKDAGMSDDVRAEVVNAISRNPGDRGPDGGHGWLPEVPFRQARHRQTRWLPGGVVLLRRRAAGLPDPVFGKNEKDNLSKDERNALKAMSRTLADRYRKSKQEKPGK
jgi:hypothetical protein